MVSCTCSRLTTGYGHPISESREQRSPSPQHDEVLGASQYPRPTNRAPTGVRYASPPSPEARFSSPQRTDSGRGTIGTMAHGAPQFPGVQDSVAAHTRIHKSLPAPCANPGSPHGHPMSRAACMSSGNLSGPLSQRWMFPACDGILSTRTLSTDGHSKSLELVPGTTPCISSVLERRTQFPVRYSPPRGCRT
jgi:hypothetical protein